MERDSFGVCRLVMNKETQQAKGTAFVEYWDTSAAQAAAAACQKARCCLTAALLDVVSTSFAVLLAFIVARRTLQHCSDC